MEKLDLSKIISLDPSFSGEGGVIWVLEKHKTFMIQGL